MTACFAARYDADRNVEHVSRTTSARGDGGAGLRGADVVGGGVVVVRRAVRGARVDLVVAAVVVRGARVDLVVAAVVALVALDSFRSSPALVPALSVESGDADDWPAPSSLQLANSAPSVTSTDVTLIEVRRPRIEPTVTTAS
ncbi:MAG: hypothetical protein M3517_12845 [Actinomycetota bacterium]|nr:hypothetical protein [Actinomycetota bacterium]